MESPFSPMCAYRAREFGNALANTAHLANKTLTFGNSAPAPAPPTAWPVRCVSALHGGVRIGPPGHTRLPSAARRPHEVCRTGGTAREPRIAGARLAGGSPLTSVVAFQVGTNA